MPTAACPLSCARQQGVAEALGGVCCWFLLLHKFSLGLNLASEILPQALGVTNLSSASSLLLIPLPGSSRATFAPSCHQSRGCHMPGGRSRAENCCSQQSEANPSSQPGLSSDPPGLSRGSAAGQGACGTAGVGTRGCASPQPAVLPSAPARGQLGRELLAPLSPGFGSEGPCPSCSLCPLEAAGGWAGSGAPKLLALM